MSRWERFDLRSAEPLVGCPPAPRRARPCPTEPAETSAACPDELRCPLWSLVRLLGG
jgi:hypothetical protein